MVIGDFHLFRSLFRPMETKSVLLVDSNAVLSFPISGKGFQTIARRAFQVIEVAGGVKDEEFGSGSPPDVRREYPGGEPVKKFFGFLAGKGPYHM